MKGIKKLLTGILAATMIMGCTVTSFADDAVQPQGGESYSEQGSEDSQGTETAATASITITNAKKGQEYKAYRVFDFVPSSSDMSSGVYKLSSKFAGFTSASFSVENGVIAGKITESKDGQPTAAAQAAAVQLGKDVMNFVADKKISEDGSNTAQKDESLKISVDAFGYYVVNSSLGVAVAVDTTHPNANIAEKNDIPHTEKKVQEGNAWGDTSDANIGDKVYYKSIVKIPVGGVHNVTFRDEMTDSLTLDTKSIAISVGNDKAEPITPDIDNHGFTIKFKDSYTSDPTIHKDTVTEIEITYSATLNENAVIKGNEKTNEYGSGNDNKSRITYGNNTETDWDFTRTYTYPVKIVKINSQQEALEGAEFTLAKEAAPDSLISFVKTGDVYRVANNGETGVTSSIVVGKNGIRIEGLDRDVYRLTETKAPEGYNLLTPDANDITKHYVTFTIAATPVCNADTEALKAILDKNVPVVTYTSDYLKSNDNTSGSFTIEEGLKVVNTTGTLLPSTGGIGTTIFYIVGGILIIAGVAYFILRRKTNAD